MGNTGSCVGRSASAPKTGDGSPTPHGIPLPPGKPRLRHITDTTIHIEWDKPQSDGGSTIFAYIIKMCKTGSAWRKMEADCEGLEYQAKNLEPGTGYKFFVQCENDNGVSKPSDISDVFTTNSLGVSSSASPEPVSGDSKTPAASSAAKYIKEEEAKGGKVEKSEDKSDDSDSAVDESDTSDRSRKHHSSDSKSDIVNVGDKEKTSGKDDASDVEDGKNNNSDDFKFMDDDDNAATVTEHHEFKINADIFTPTKAVPTQAQNPSFVAKTKDGDDVGSGRPLNEPLLYQYSNDSLLDDNTETCNRFNERAFSNEDPITIHKSFNSTIEEYHTIDNEIPDDHRIAFEELGYDIDADYNRLSIISEQSMEESIGTPDATRSPNKDSHHFKFEKKIHDNSHVVETSNASKKEVEENKTKISGFEKSSIVSVRSNTESKPAETRIPMMGTRSKESVSTTTSTVSQETTSTVKEVKVQSRLPTLSGFIPKEIGVKEPERQKSSIPEPEKKTSIPKMAPPKDKTFSQAKADKAPAPPPPLPASQIPARRDAGGKVSFVTPKSDYKSLDSKFSGIPSVNAQRNVDPKAIIPLSNPIRNAMPSASASASASASVSVGAGVGAGAGAGAGASATGTKSQSGIPTGIAVRRGSGGKSPASEPPKTSGSPQSGSQTRIPSFGNSNRSGVPAPKVHVSAT